MAMYACLAVLLLLFIAIQHVQPQEMDDQEFLDQLLHELMHGVVDNANSLTKRVTAEYEMDPTSAHLNNMMGVVAYHQRDMQRAARYFRHACEQNHFQELGYIRNYMSAQAPLNATDAEQFIFHALEKNPYSYPPWIYGAEMLLKKHLQKIADVSMSKDGSASLNQAVFLNSELELVLYGLTLFPRSPELRLLRALHYHLTAQGACATHFLTIANDVRHLQQEHAKPQFDQYFAVITQLIQHSTVSDSDANTGAVQCLPQFSPYTVASFQPVHTLISTARGPNWADIGNARDPTHTTPNALVASSMFKTSAFPALGSDVYLPSLHVGCSEYDRCVKSGFLIADGMDVVSTHFVTQAYDLSMLESASFGLVYSSHTLEHLSHNNPPASCATYPKSDRGVPGCYSEVDSALAEWRRVLVPGGTLLIAVPDITYLLTYFSDPAATMHQKAVLQKFIYGGQTSEYDFHKTGFYAEYLEELLVSHDFCNVTRVGEFSVFKDSSSLHFGPGRPISLNFHAIACPVRTA